MKLFGFFNKKENDIFPITESDKIWVEDNFKWLINVYGYPHKKSEQIHISEHFFPNTFKEDKVLIENIIIDLSSLLHISQEKICIEVVKDIRDSYGVPYQIDGKPFETDLEIDDNKYKIYIANSLNHHPKRLIYCLVYEFVKIKLTENKLEFDTGNDTDLFIYLAGIYFGFGVLLSQHLKEIGREDDGFWETKWHYVSEMPKEIMAYALAIYSTLIEQDSPKWKDQLPNELKSQFEKAIKYIHDHPNSLYDNKELLANELFEISNDQYQNNLFEEAIATLQKILFLTNDDFMKATVYNNIGYYNIRLRNYEQSINYFLNTLKLIPDYGYAFDNMGYSLIQLGKLEDGKSFLDKAHKTENNDIAYTYRNYALYYQAKGDVNKTEDYFKKSFESMSESVDLLEYHYADFLLKNGDTENGLKFLKQAVAKGEVEAIERMNAII